MKRIVLLILFALLLQLIETAFRHIKPYKQGFFCNDFDIRLPYVRSIIPAKPMHITYSLIGLLLIAFTEFANLKRVISSERSLNVYEIHPFQKFRIQIHPFMLNFFYFYAQLACIVVASNAITSLAKRTASRLRPNFFHSCRPNVSDSCLAGSNEYISIYNCLGSSSDEAYFSFPSGHCSTTTSFVVFMIYYLQYRLKLNCILRAALQFSLLLMAICVCLSRVQNFMHRYSDVCAGAVLGAVVAAFSVYNIFNKFKECFYIAGEERSLQMIKVEKEHPRSFIDESSNYNSSSDSRHSHKELLNRSRDSQ